MKVEIENIDRVVLLGGGNVLVALAKWCLSQNMSVSVVTSPRHSSEIVEEEVSLIEVLESFSINYLVTEDIGSSDAKVFLADLSQSLCLSLGAAWIFKERVIEEVFRNRLFNLHGTRLPQNRGGGGFSWQILMGNRLGFCQLHLVDAGVDTGDIVLTREFLYPPSCRLPIDYERFHFNQTLDFVVGFISEIRQVGIALQTVKQSEYLSTYWPRLNTSTNAWIDWSEDVSSLEKFICAFDEPYEGAKSYLDDQKVYIKDVMVDFSDPHFHLYQAGIVFRKSHSWVSVCANGGTLIVQKIIDEQGDNLIEKVRVGDRLNTPLSALDSRTKRVVYTPSGLK